MWIFLKKHVCNNKREAIIKLKGWKIDANTYERLWQFYYSEQYDCLYKSYRKEWHSGEHLAYEGYDGIGDGFFTFESSFERSDQLPLDTVPVSVEVIQTKDGTYQNTARMYTKDLKKRSIVTLRHM